MQKYTKHTLTYLSLFLAIILSIPDVAESHDELGESKLREALSQIDSGNIDSGLSTLYRLADEKNYMALRYLHIFFDMGMNVEQDKKLARCWLRKASSLQNPPPISDLNEFNWTLNAAKHDYPGAQFSIAMAYAHGDWVEKDLVEAMAWLILARLKLQLDDWQMSKRENKKIDELDSTVIGERLGQARIRAVELWDQIITDKDFPC